MTAASAEIYRWIDVNGKSVYGDEPPENARAVEPVDLPTLTVAESFKGKAKVAEKPVAPAVKTEPLEEIDTDKAEAEAAVASQQTNKESEDPIVAAGYEKFSILSPASDSVVRSNTGDLSIQLEVKPSLQTGHSIVVYVDGKQAGETSATAVALNGLARGEHNVFAVLHDAKKGIIGNTESVNFSVVRTSVVR